MKDEVRALPSADRQRRLERAYQRLASAGAHYVVDGIGDVPAVVDDINRRLASGERP